MVDYSNINEYVNSIRSAKYGEEVRGSISNALLAMKSDIDMSDAGLYAKDNASIKDMIRFGNSIYIFSIDQSLPVEQRLISYQVKSGRIYRI